MTQTIVEAVCAGVISALPGGKRSGIFKTPIEGGVAIGLRGIEADRQADRRHHGFPAMALHHYPQDHYGWLQDVFGPLPRLCGPGSMGENMTTTGLTEADVAIGDRFRFGTALLEVSQPRQPCATIERHLQAKGIVKAIVRSGRCGWFYRVLEPGFARAGDPLTLLERGDTGWTIRRAFAAVYGPQPDVAAMRELAKVPRVSDRLVHDIMRRLPS